MTNKPLLLEDKKPMNQLLVLVAFILVSTVVFAMASLVAAAVIFKVKILDPAALSDYANPSTVQALKFMQFWQAFGLFVIPPVAWLFLVTRDKAGWLKLNRLPAPFIVLLTFLFVLASQPLINITAEINNQMSLPGFLSGVEEWMKASEAKAAELTKIFLNATDTSGFLINLLVIAILPGFGEELLFRGALQPLLVKATKNHHAGIWISAFLFSALHMQFYGFIPRFLLGGAFGYLFHFSGNLWYPMLGHLFNNGTAVVVSYLAGKGLETAGMESVGTGENDWWMGVLSVILCVGFFLFIKRSFAGTHAVSPPAQE